MLQQHELFPGAIININGLPTVVSGILPPAPRDDRFSDKWVVITPLSNVLIDDCRPIPLTEKILTDWCGFEEMYRSKMHLTLELPINDSVCIYYYEWYNDDGSIKNKYIEIKGDQQYDIPLHLLQMLVFALTQQPLKITLP
jgi:hypothetical protein